MSYALPPDECCKTCGQKIPPKGLPEGIKLTKVQRRVWDAVSSWPGMTAKEVTDWVYGHDPNGGPETDNCIRVIINYANRRLRPHGIQITGKDHEGYRVESINGR